MEFVFSKVLTPSQIAERKLLDYTEGTIKNKCAKGELLCHKVGKQWILDTTYLKDTRKVEVWQRHEDSSWGDSIGMFIPHNEIKEYVMLEVDKKNYLKINFDELENEDFYDENGQLLDEKELLEIIDWYDIEEQYTYTENYIEKEDFTVEYAIENGFIPPSETAPTYKGYNYWDSGLNLVSLFEEEMALTQEYIISDEYVDLDLWNGSNHQTNSTGIHQVVYRILKVNGDFSKDLQFMIVEFSDWQGAQPHVVLVGDLDDVLAHIDELGEREPNAYIDELKSL